MNTYITIPLSKLPKDLSVPSVTPSAMLDVINWLERTNKGYQFVQFYHGPVNQFFIMRIKPNPIKPFKLK